MTRRHDQIIHRNKLCEIRNIMNSMKTLAVMETHKLERIIETQTALKSSIENIAKDFLHFNPQVLPEVKATSSIILLIGSERGFCGDFNETITKKLETILPETSESNTTLILVGHKLNYTSTIKNINIINIQGASIAEDILSVVDSISQILSTYKSLLSFDVLHHNNQHNNITTKRLIPPFTDIHINKVAYTNPPILNLTPHNFFLELIEHYLFNSLHRILYASLLIENQQRIQHLENASHYLDKKSDELKHKINALRQEEIIEEIEVILLNASTT